MNVSTKPRLCVILGGHFSATRGGAQYQAEVLVDELVKRDEYEIFYLCRHTDPDFVPNGYSIRVLNSPKVLHRFGFVADSLDLYRQLREIAPAVIYQHGLKAYTGVAAWYAARHDCRMVFHIASDMDVLPVREQRARGIRGVEPIDQFIGEYGLRHADAIVSQTETQSALLRAYFQRESDALVKNFHPCPTEHIDKSGPVTVAWVANFKRVKRPEVFVDLAEQLAGNADVRFVMVGRPGDPRDYTALHERIRRLDNLEYLGELPHEQVNEVLARSHVLVNTSTVEGFPNTFVQAWMRGLPVVTLGLNNDGMFDDGSLGYCSRDFDALKQNVLELATNHALRESLGASARARAMAEHSIGNVDALVDVLRGNARP